MSYYMTRAIRNSTPQASRPIPIPTPIRERPSETPVVFPDESTDSSDPSGTEKGPFLEALSHSTGTPRSLTEPESAPGSAPYWMQQAPGEKVSSGAGIPIASAAIDIPPPNVAGRCRLSLNDYSTPPVEISTFGLPGSLDGKTTAMRNPREARLGEPEDPDLQFNLDMDGDRPG
ncbi:MAG: hypothetical protein EOO24_03175 [Comamonadaceae bacterium]|nr:MAG: hypothetical protein EOO24_03175 [Comamonadaceae bacterium]